MEVPTEKGIVNQNSSNNNMKYLRIVVLVIIIVTGSQIRCFSQYHEGDTLKFWSVTYIDWPPLQGEPQREVNAICRKAGDHCYLFVEDSSEQYLTANTDTLVDMFDHHFYDSLTFRYGPVPDAFDNDSNIFILVFNETNWGGYFDPGQQMPDSMVYARWNRHSSEREIIYVSVGSFNYNATGVVAHEFGHLLHWQQDHSPEPVANPVKYWEDAWIDEGFSTFASVYLTENFYQNDIPDEQTFFATNPDRPQIYFSNYNQAKLLMMFMYEHFGKWDYISGLICEQYNGISGINSTLGNLGYTETFDDAFEQFVIANCIDNPLYDGGKYSYAHYSFAGPSYSSTYSPLTNGTKNATVNPYGADYVRFFSSTPKPLTIEFNGQTNSKFRVDFILKNNSSGEVYNITGAQLDSLNHTTFFANDLGTLYNSVVMVVINIDSSLQENNTAAYSYSSVLNTGIYTDGTESTIEIFPNPAASIVSIVNNIHSDKMEINITNIHGENVLNTICHNQNIADIDVSTLTKGMYIVKVQTDKGRYVRKLIIE